MEGFETMYKKADVPARERVLFGTEIEERSPQMAIYAYGMTIEDYEALATDFSASGIDFLAFSHIDSREKAAEVEEWLMALDNFNKLYEAEKLGIDPNSNVAKINLRKEKEGELRGIIEEITTIATRS